MASPRLHQRFYLGNMATYFAAAALNVVVIPWIVLHELELGPQELGIAQAALTLPMACLVIFGGWWADRRERRSTIAFVTIIIGLAPFLLGLSGIFFRIEYSSLILSLFVIGLCGALINPSRDTMMSTIAGTQVQKFVSLTILVQSLMQAVGYALGGVLGIVPVSYLLMAQGLVWWTGSLIAFALPKDQPAKTRRSIREDLKSILQGKLASVLLASFLVNALISGVYLVLVPIKVLDIYELGAVSLAATNLIFMLGAMISSALIMKRRGFNGRQGRIVLVSCIVAAITIVTLSMQVPFSAFLGLILSFGAISGVIAMVLRSIVQIVASAETKGLALSMYNLSTLGGGTLGATFMGLLAANLTHEMTVIAAAVLLLTGSLAITAFTQLRTISMATDQ